MIQIYTIDFGLSLGIKPKTRFVVFVIGNNIVIRKLHIPDIKKEWNRIFQNMDKKDLKLDENNVAAEIKGIQKSKTQENKELIKKSFYQEKIFFKSSSFAISL